MGKCFDDNNGVSDCDKLRAQLQSKHDANCLLRLLLETLPIKLEQEKLTHDRTACAMLIQNSIDYLFRDGEDTLIESPSNDEQQTLKLAYQMGFDSFQSWARKEIEANRALVDITTADFNKAHTKLLDMQAALIRIADYHGTTEEVWSNSMKTIASEALADRP